MQDFGGAESFVPSEGEGGVSEAASEAARARFAGAQQAVAQIRKEEKKAKQQDDGVAQAILQFLNDRQRAHLAALIARLVGRDCPSPFLLAVLSLISPQCENVVQEYLQENAAPNVQTSTLPVPIGNEESRQLLTAWIGRMERVLATQADAVLKSLVLPGGQLDASILQLTAVVIQEFLHAHGHHEGATLDESQRIAAGILQQAFAPHMQTGKLEEKNAA